ncbi:MAG: DUF447 family protein [Planctomycetaceae bacterium]|nr:DUF447 family protein [Planctomycetaceae bacterium]
MICEGLVTSLSDDGQINVAPMGPLVETDFQQLILRPFQSSTTFRNLNATRCGVFHVIDAVDVIAEAAIGRLQRSPPTEPAVRVAGAVLQDCCHWYEFRIDRVDASEMRSVMHATVVHFGIRRPFWGLNRARHAILEAAILATRLHLIPIDEVKRSLEFLRSAVEKTGGAVELQTFAMLCDFVEQADNR